MHFLFYAISRVSPDKLTQTGTQTILECYLQHVYGKFRE